MLLAADRSLTLRTDSHAFVQPARLCESQIGKVVGWAIDWVEANGKSYDFNRFGWPAWYPTRSLQDWEQARALWELYVFRSPTNKVPRPEIVHSKKKKKN